MAASAFALLTTTTVHLQAQGISGNSSSRLTDAQTSQAAPAEQYWTPERLHNAKPMELTPSAGPDGLPLQAAKIDNAVRALQPVVKNDGAPPSVEVGASLRKQLIPVSMARQIKAQSQAKAMHTPVPEATSSFGAYFTTSRVFPDAALTTYPYSAAGKLFFSDPKTGGNAVCSASVLRPRIIVTAGHCVSHPSTVDSERYLYSNFQFIPAYNYGNGPFGTWTPSHVLVTNTWYYSDGSVPNEQDVAMLVANDSDSHRLGDITGWLGFSTGQLGKNHVTMLGYPCNLDNCEHMEETSSQSYQDGGSNTVIYGSAMRGGSSGGPWIQDFGVAPDGAPAGLLGNNYLVAVTSYGPT